MRNESLLRLSMSTVKELYDNAFLSCVKSGAVTDTDDNYDNPIVIKSVLKHSDVQRVYQLELQYELNKIRLFQNLNVLLGPDSEIRAKAAQLIWSYILYLKIMNAPEVIIHGLDCLYTCVNQCIPLSTELDNLLDLQVLPKDYGLDLTTFLNRLSELLHEP